jgi:hypothetical protein
MKNRTETTVIAPIDLAVVSSEFHGSRVISRHRYRATATIALDRYNRQHRKECSCCGGHIGFLTGNLAHVIAPVAR